MRQKAEPLTLHMNLATPLQKLCLGERIGYFGTGRNTLLPPCFEHGSSLRGTQSPVASPNSSIKRVSQPALIGLLRSSCHRFVLPVGVPVVLCGRAAESKFSLLH